MTKPAALDPQAIAKLDGMAVKARTIVSGALSGMHRARSHGSSVEFAEHKEYAPGDEIRHLDWKVYAKADRYYIKRFEKESELTCHIVLDASGSMAYRGNSTAKVEYATYLAAALAYLLLGQGDRVALHVFGDPKLERYVPPRSSHLPDLLAVLEDVMQRGGSGNESLGTALERVAELARQRRGLVIAISDFFDRDPRSLEVLRFLRARGYDTRAIHLLHRDELDFPFDGLTLFRPLEVHSGEDVPLLVHPNSVRRAYQDKLSAFLTHVRTECLAAGVDYTQISSDRPLDRALHDVLSAGQSLEKAPWAS